MSKQNWKTAKIQDVCEVVTGGTPRTEKAEYWDGDINWMSSGEVNKRRVKSVDRKITKAGLDSSNAKVLPVQTIMIALAGQGKTRGKVAILDTETTCNQSLAGMIVKNKFELDPEYLFQYLENRYEDFRNLSGGEGRSGLNLNLIRNFVIAFPSTSVQRKFSKILKDIDEEVIYSDQIIQRTEQLKLGLLLQILSAKHWSEEKFETLFAEPLKNGLNRPTKVRGSGVKMVNMGELFKYPKIYDQDMELVPLSDSESNYYLKYGDLLFARQSLVREGAGKCSIFLGSNKSITYEGHIIRVRLDQNTSDPKFYFYLFQSPIGRSKIERLITQTAAAGVRGSDLAQVKVPVPPMEEQKKASVILESLDEKITFEQSNRKKLMQLKQGLMQDIFSRKVEVN